jgi:hypothetical protein
MCEIIFLWVLGRQLAARARDKGHAPAGYVVMLVVLWFVAEILGCVIGALIGMVLEPNARDPNMLIMLLFGYGGAAVAAVSCFGLVAMLPDRSRSQLYDDRYGADDYYREWRRDLDERWDKGTGQPSQEDPWAKDERFEK